MTADAANNPDTLQIATPYAPYPLPYYRNISAVWQPSLVPGVGAVLMTWENVPVLPTVEGDVYVMRLTDSNPAGSGSAKVQIPGPLTTTGTALVPIDLNAQGLSTGLSQVDLLSGPFTGWNYGTSPLFETS